MKKILNLTKLEIIVNCLTGKNRAPAHRKCNNNFTQDKSKFGCIKFLDIYRFLSSSLDSLVWALIDNNDKTLKNIKEEIVDIDERLNIVHETKILNIEDRYNIDSIKDLKKKGFWDAIENIEGALIKYMVENDLKILETEFPDKWKNLTIKSAYPYEFSFFLMIIKNLLEICKMKTSSVN